MSKTLRSRTGCWTCRNDGYKCDEKKPFCRRCLRLRKTCTYGARLRWRTNTSSNASGERPDKPVQQGTQAVVPMTRIPDVKFGDEKLVHHWHTTLADVISMSARPNNPFLSHLTRFISQPCALRSVVTSMAASHLAILDPNSNLDVLAIQHRLQAVIYLRESIATAHPETSLATIILLLIAEKVFTTDSKIDHLEGAKALIRKNGGPRAWSSSAGQFLLGVCWYHDVLSSVSKRRPLLLDLENQLVEGLPTLSNLSLVLSLVGEISKLGSDLEKGGGDGGAAQAIFSQLVLLEESEPLDTNSRNVEIFRQAAFIYFYRSTTPTEFSNSGIQHHARLCLEHLANIPCSSPLISSHVWPLFTAGCETVDPDMKEFVLQRLDDMCQTRRLTYLERVKQDIIGVWYMKNLRRGESGRDDIDCIHAIKNTHQREADII